MALVCFGYLMVYKHPDNVALKALDGNTLVFVEDTDYGYFMDGPGEGTAFVFYPGEKIAVECYAPLMQQIAEKGIDVFMMDMPFNMSFLNSNAADRVIDKENYASWYVGGHSLGGVTASRYADRNADKVDGVILLASSPTKEISDDLRLLSVCASLDGILSEDEYQKNKENWPAQSAEYVIKGGNHTNFANCSMIRGDNEATALYTTQQRQCSEAVVGFVGVELPQEGDPADQPSQEDEVQPEPEPLVEVPKEKPVLLADRLNDNSELWSGDYTFPENEDDIYTSIGRYCYMHVMSFATQEHSDTVVIYIHGGAYIGDFDNGFYYPVVKQIALDTGYEVLVPQYPLLTGFNFTHAYICLQSLYYRVMAEYGSDHVIVMGDSAGGALAAGLCLQAAENNWEQPSQLVLVSPWVDLMITHPETDRYQELDKNLDAYMLRLYGEYWAAGENPS
ncbi:MAG: alpha/beta hydrolase fold domain-containing protein, partial [Oscillospiraceae bacterium]|nr:alpha/beta hydrolase fold domain-containing protein [Oscillospiraceae bacterium]